jgi:hypothetical protein
MSAIMSALYDGLSVPVVTMPTKGAPSSAKDLYVKKKKLICICSALMASESTGPLFLALSDESYMLCRAHLPTVRTCRVIHGV